LTRAAARSVGVAILVVGGAAWCSGEDPVAAPRPYLADATRRMGDLLEDLGYRLDEKLVALHRDRTLLGYTRLVIDPPRNERSELILESQRASERLLAGDAAEAARRFRLVKDALVRDRSLLDSAFFDAVQERLAIACLRMGEQSNCVCRHGAESCLFPIQGSGVHAEQEGSRAAIRELREILERYPSDLASRWLLNVAVMTVGEYPAGVPEPLLIPPGAFVSKADLGRFRDVAGEIGIDSAGLAGGCVMEDFDGDGAIDVLLSSFGLDRNRDGLRLFRNDGFGRFADRTVESGLSGLIGGTHLSQADIDNDGDADVLVLRGGGLGALGQQPPSLLLNNGDGTFDDVTKTAGLLSFHPSSTAAWADYDGDGLVDVFVGIESDSADGVNRSPRLPYAYSQSIRPCLLLRNRGDGTFADESYECGLTVIGYVKGAAWGDTDEDGLPDLYVSAMNGPNRLFRNRGRDASGSTRFVDVTETAGVAEPVQSLSCAFRDFDGDGALDLFVSGYSARDLASGPAQVAASYLGLPFVGETPRVYRNARDGTFEDVTHDVGLDGVLFSLGFELGDLDADGWPDLYVGTGGPGHRLLIPNRLYRNVGGRSFEDATTASGVGHLQRTGAVALGDVDFDGWLDVLAVVGGELPGDAFQRCLFRNPGSANHRLVIALEGTRSNRSAIGARIRVTVADADGAPRTIHATVSSGGAAGSSPLRRTIGLGAATDVRSVEVRWPTTGTTQSLVGVPADSFVRIREGERVPVEVRALPSPRAAPTARREAGAR